MLRQHAHPSLSFWIQLTSRDCSKLEIYMKLKNECFKFDIRAKPPLFDLLPLTYLATVFDNPSYSRCYIFFVFPLPLEMSIFDATVIPPFLYHDRQLCNTLRHNPIAPLAA